MMICYNLRRLMSIYSLKELKNKLKRLVSNILLFYGSIRLDLRDFKLNLNYFNHLTLPNFKPVEDNYVGII
jgi:hypothetical protein